MLNPYAIYVYCDGAMSYDVQNSGGIGFRIEFPDFIDRPPIERIYGVYKGGNIHQLELEALAKAMNETLQICKELGKELNEVQSIIFRTDRYDLRGDGLINENKISAWRKNKWKNHENKPIKHHRQLDELDKIRTKLRNTTYKRVDVEYIRRKENKRADKLSKKGKTEGLPIDKLKNRGEKIGTRLYDKGGEVKYKTLQQGEYLIIHIFLKTPVQNEWEIKAEICDGLNKGEYLNIYVNDEIAERLNRGNVFKVRVETVYAHYVRIRSKFRKLRKVRFK